MIYQHMRISDALRLTLSDCIVGAELCSSLRIGRAPFGGGIGEERSEERGMGLDG